MAQNALTTVDATCFQRIIDPLAWVEKTGHMIWRSGMFKCKSIEQGCILALISLTEQLPTLELLRRYHLMDGQLVMRADYMRAELRRLNGDYDWVNDGEDGKEARCWIEFKGRKREVVYTINDAKKEGIVKPGSRWVKAPGDMLRARCSTKAIRMVASEVLAGFYTDEEMGLEDTETKPAKQPEDAAVDAEFEVKHEAAVKAAVSNGSKPADPLAGAVPVTQASTQPDEKGNACLATPEQVASICGAMNQLGMNSEQRGKALAKRHANTVDGLSYSQAGELLRTLNDKVDAKRKAALDAANGRTAASETVTQAAPRPDDGTICSDVQVESVKALLLEINQVSPGFANDFKTKLRASGREKVAELTAVQCDALIEQLKLKNLEKFFADQLKPKAKEQPARDPIVGEYAKN